jgi:hypothetical protein
MARHNCAEADFIWYDNKTFVWRFVVCLGSYKGEPWGFRVRACVLADKRPAAFGMRWWGNWQTRMPISMSNAATQNVVVEGVVVGWIPEGVGWCRRRSDQCPLKESKELLVACLALSSQFNWRGDVEAAWFLALTQPIKVPSPRRFYVWRCSRGNWLRVRRQLGISFFAILMFWRYQWRGVDTSGRCKYWSMINNSCFFGGFFDIEANSLQSSACWKLLE